MELDLEKTGRDDYNPDTNWSTLSDVMCSCNPKPCTHELRRADAHDVAVSSSIIVASGHRVERSVTVNK